MILPVGTRVRVMPGAVAITYSWIPPLDEDDFPTVTYSVKKYEEEFVGRTAQVEHAKDLRDPDTTTIVVDDAGTRHVFSDDNAIKYVVSAV